VALLITFLASAAIAAGALPAGAIGALQDGATAAPAQPRHAARRAAAARAVGRHARRVHAAAAPALKLIWGPVDLPNGESAFPIYHQLGVNVFQIDLNWAQTAPSRPADPQDPNDPAYLWPAQLDQALSAAAQYGIKLCLLVQGTPPWANGGRSTDWAPNDPTDYGNFLIAASRRYPAVRKWMVWGEPNRDGNFEPMPLNSPVGPRRYALVLNAAYHALKQASAANLVIGGDTWSFGTVEPGDFVRWMRLPNGKPPPLDYYGHNPFSRRFPDLSEPPYFPGGRDINDIDTLEAQLVGLYHRPVKLWLSEFTIASDHANRAFDFSFSRKQQARWLAAAFALANSVDYVAGMGWFNLVDEPPSTPKNQNLTQGLMTWNLQRKPAFYAYQRAR
jgi:hypothetical protein